jgi:hypothetical protein
MVDPTKVNGGLPADLQSILARAKGTVDQKQASVELHIVYNVASGELQMAGPRDPMLFYGILEMARDTFNAQQQQARAEQQSRIAIPPGALADEGRTPQ